MAILPEVPHLGVVVARHNACGGGELEPISRREHKWRRPRRKATNSRRAGRLPAAVRFPRRTRLKIYTSGIQEPPVSKARLERGLITTLPPGSPIDGGVKGR